MSPAQLARVYGTRKTRFAYCTIIIVFLLGVTGILAWALGSLGLSRESSLFTGPS